jgi:hypothetical protein
MHDKPYAPEDGHPVKPEIVHFLDYIDDKKLDVYNHKDDQVEADPLISPTRAFAARYFSSSATIADPTIRIYYSQTVF